MYLKNIDMQGFKSFAGKTRMEFHDGITGIVGPNGSGKSNVADAVRWVLGEQSAKQLRGGNMQDVIFAGTENRRPLGYASVAITLDNSDKALKYDAEEITVTRRLYRSGESEYMLNGRSCRLKDINELFYDTGIGKEGYSIIGQGQIDKILSGKPEDRRELFDEAAGIVKFKRRKAASLKKLEQEESNLVRVNDILSEVTRQIGPLEKQAEKAEIFLSKRDSLRDKDIQLFLSESGYARKQEEELRKNIAIAEEHRLEIEREFEKTRQEYDQVEKDLEELDSRIEKNRNDAQKAALLKQESQGKISLLQEQIRAAQTNAALYQNHLDQIQEEFERRKQAKDEQQIEKEELLKSLQAANVAKEEKEADVLRIQAAIDDYAMAAEKGRIDTIDLLNERSSIRAKIQHYETMQENVEIRRAEISAQMLAIKQDKALEEEKEKKLEEELETLSEEVSGKQKEADENESRIESLQQELIKGSKELEETRTAFHRDSSRLESLRNIAERYEGYGNSVKKIMEQMSSNPGILGVVAELIKTDKKYETAIETALGGSLQHVVTDNESTAKYLIEYLKTGKFGRVTFLPLTAVRDEEAFSNDKVLKEPGVLGTAEQLVKHDARFNGVFNRLLGHTVVVDQIDHAIAVSRKYNRAVRMVTLEGELLNKGGSMTGGSFKYNSNLLGRKRQIEELEASVKKLQGEIHKLQDDTDARRKERGTLQAESAVLAEELQKLLLKQNTVQMNLKAEREKAEAIRNEYRRLSDERNEIDGQTAEISETASLIREELQLSETQEKELEDRIKEVNRETERLRETEQSALEEQDKARLEYYNILQQCEFADEKLQTSEAELCRIEEERKSLEESMIMEGGDVQDKEKEIEKAHELIAQLEEGMARGETETAALLNQKEELNRSHREFFDQRDELSEQKNRIEQELFRLHAQEEKLTETMEHLINYLYEEYQITPDQAAQYSFGEIPSRNQLKKEISSLKTEIRALGDVNVNAVSEYRELKERHDFLNAQHQDLVDAAETLHGIIDELDEGMRRQFRERFSLIREEFDKVFKELFGGGKGTLELIEGEDILDSGVQIISQPPGKKLQNMMQLSGGEKALTAIALLFAIQDLKPSPFCLLDEIEAALDDNNVGRFAGYLHKLTKHTQFIVITHRRGTMTAADRLYGITMQEKGISTMVSVDLIETQLDA